MQRDKRVSRRRVSFLILLVNVKHKPPGSELDPGLADPVHQTGGCVCVILVSQGLEDVSAEKQT